MRNKIIMIILLISIILVIILASFGFKLGNFEIPSISRLLAKNKETNINVDELTRLTSETYPAEISKLETSIEELGNQRKKYEEVSGFSADDMDKMFESQNYDIVYLWNILGQYATKNKIKIVIDVRQAAGTDLYDLYFTLQGEYVNVSTFISKIENDSDLQFRIYNFKLVPGKSDIDLKATFVVKDVNIDGKTISKQTTNTNENLDNTINTTNTTEEQEQIESEEMQ